MLSIRGNIGVVSAIFRPANQLPSHVIEAFNNQLRLAWVSPCQRDMQILANALDRNVFRGEPLVTFGKNIMTAFDRLDSNSVACASGLELHSLSDCFAIDDGNTDWADTHGIAFYMGQGLNNSISQVPCGLLLIKV